jgi:hypothetical protein
MPFNRHTPFKIAPRFRTLVQVIHGTAPISVRRMRLARMGHADGERSRY